MPHDVYKKIGMGYQAIGRLRSLDRELEHIRINLLWEENLKERSSQLLKSVEFRFLKMKILSTGPKREGLSRFLRRHRLK